ncbi:MULTISPECIES: tyrosine-type recombinase/integrase [Novosphingobium]|uniref:Site-specific recombinase XerD n=1 Tax=Novosphingobium mathurense TaxID=428990 RepID=A0A1U6IVM3_9SPHN|nr:MULTISPECIES: site-specific integrase [Novosphingobium]CDO36014.1 Integrase [Novosphingobium sp. KN65.2]SLK12033.1 Site-specific recombinase XerD [Novosphingobium mathurense]
MPRPNTGPRLKRIDGRPNFYIVWFEGGRERRRSTGTADGREAEAVLGAFLRERELSIRPAGPARPNDYLIASALDLYGTLHAPTAADPKRIAYAMVPLLTFWGEQTVDAITKQTCKAYRTWRKKSDGTVRRELVVLKAALNFAHSEGRLTTVPHVELPAKPEGRDRWLTQKEAAALLWAARSGRSDVRLYLPLFILIGLYTGARRDAILSLRWPNVDLEAGRIYFARSGDRQTSKRKVVGQPIPRRLMTFLRLARDRGTELGYVVHNHGERIKDIGGGWDGNEDKRGEGSFGGACKRAGLIDVTPHVLRHTCGTWMAQRGVPLHLIGGWLGHKDARTTALYAHHHPDHMAEALAAADRR